jgi:hypothetical protein
VNRTYEHRRAAYVDFLQEIQRLERTYIPSPPEPIHPPRSLTDPAYKRLVECFAVLEVYGTPEAQNLAVESMTSLVQGNLTVFDIAGPAYLNRIRKDLGLAEIRDQDPDRL